MNLTVILEFIRVNEYLLYYTFVFLSLQRKINVKQTIKHLVGYFNFLRFILFVDKKK